MDSLTNLALLFDKKISLEIGVYIYKLSVDVSKLNQKEVSSLKSLELRIKGESLELVLAK